MSKKFFFLYQEYVITILKVLLDIYRSGLNILYYLVVYQSGHNGKLNIMKKPFYRRYRTTPRFDFLHLFLVLLHRQEESRFSCYFVVIAESM